VTAMFRGVLFITVYALSGTSRKTDREDFFNSELPPLLRTEAQRIVLGGDFNCVLHPCDVTGHFQTSKALTDLISGYRLCDTWVQNAARQSYTYYNYLVVLERLH
jgi:exonuclease III